MNNDNYDIDDGNDPLKEFLDVDLDSMSKEQLSDYLSKLNEASENPKAAKRIVSKGTKSKSKTVKIDTATLFAKLGL